MEKQFTSQKSKLRFDFIGMVFAIAIGQIGIEIAEYFSKNESITKYPYVLTHIILCTYVISTSWVGWQSSTSQGNLESINSLFKRPFLILLIDLFLVICYFILVKGVEKPIGISSFHPSSKFESYWSCWIFGLYAIWDIATKILFRDEQNVMHINFKGYLSRAYPSLLCFALVILHFHLLSHTAEAISVVIADISLLCIFILFRALKDKELNGDSKISWITVSSLLLIISVFAYYII